MCAYQTGKKSYGPQTFINVVNVSGWAQLGDFSGMRYYRLVSVRSRKQFPSAGYYNGCVRQSCVETPPGASLHLVFHPPSGESGTYYHGSGLSSGREGETEGGGEEREHLIMAKANPKSCPD